VGVLLCVLYEECGYGHACGMLCVRNVCMCVCVCVLCACVFMHVECYVCCVKNVYVELCA